MTEEYYEKMQDRWERNKFREQLINDLGTGIEPPTEEEIEEHWEEFSKNIHIVRRKEIMDISTRDIKEFREWFPELSEKFFTNFSVVRVQFTFENHHPLHSTPGEPRHTFLGTFTYNRDEK